MLKCRVDIKPMPQVPVVTTQTCRSAWSAVLQASRGTTVWTVVDRHGYFAMSKRSVSGVDNDSRFQPVIVKYSKLEAGQML